MLRLSADALGCMANGGPDHHTVDPGRFFVVMRWRSLQRGQRDAACVPADFAGPLNGSRWAASGQATRRDDSESRASRPIACAGVPIAVGVLRPPIATSRISRAACREAPG